MLAIAPARASKILIDQEAATVPDSTPKNPEMGRSLPSHLHGDSSHGRNDLVRCLRTEGRPQRHRNKHSL